MDCSGIRAGETQRATILASKIMARPPEIVATVVAARLAVGNEDTQVTRAVIEGGAFGEHEFILGLIVDWRDMMSVRAWNLTASRPVVPVL